MKNIYLLLLTCVLSAGTAFGQCTDLFFSEYVEGSGNTKAFEIYNPTSSSIDLSDYVVFRFQNGSPTASDSLQPLGMIAAGDVFVVANPFGDSLLQSKADTLEDVVFFGGDDAMALVNTATGDTLDIIGVVGTDPGSSWPVGSGTTQNFTLVRSDSVQEGTTDWAMSSTQWLVLPINTIDSLESHTMVPCSSGPAPMGLGCTNDLFFSEYIEGSSNNKAIEIFNPTDNPVDLSSYSIFRFNNGGSASPSGTFVGVGMLMPGDVYVIANPSSDSAILAVSDTTNSITFFNGDDYLLLVNTLSGDSLDAIGIFGNDPGSSWPIDTLGATANFTLVRNIGIQEGELDWAIGEFTWDVHPINTFDSLGMHTMTPCPPVVPGPGCSDDLFFSEYIEGSSSNKALEIYNPMDTMVDLTNYVIYRFNNGSLTATDSLFPQGSIASDSVFVIGNPSGNPAIMAQTDTTHTITFYNGDDALLLINMTTGDTLDAIGEVGVDPGSGWTVGAGATNNFTLVRMIGIQQGETDWTIGSTQWDVFPIDMTDSLGMHTMTPCGIVVGPMPPVVSFAGAAMNVNEGAGTATVNVMIQNPDSLNPTSVDVSVTGGSATSGADYTFTSPVTVTFPANSSAMQMVSITITDDLMTEGTESIELTLSSPTNNATIGGSGMYTVNIEDNDFPTYPIGTINTVDSAGLGDSTGVTAWIGGIVYGVNLRPSGLQFTIIDNTGGISLFDFNQVSGYVVQESDSISVLGTIGQFNGLLQINPDSIIVHGTGFTLKQPTQVSTLVEANESDLLVFENAYLVDPAQWTGSGSGFNLDVTNGTDTITVRVDADVDAYSLPAPTGMFNVCGLGGQFDSSSPYDDGYQLLPRYKEDFKLQLMVDLGPDTTSCDSMIMLDAGSAGGYAWSNGDTTQMTMVNVDGTYFVTITDTVYGGTATDSIDVVLNAEVVAAFGCDTIFVNAYQFNDSSANATSWMWDFGDGMTSTMQNPSHTYTSQGIYTVSLIASGPCGSDTIVKNLDTQVGIADGLSNLIKVYPNPTEGRFSVELPASQLQTATLRVVDMYGKIVREVRSDETLVQINLDDVAAGIYFIEVNMNEGRAVKRVVLR